ncbi:hypothetical protein IMG5_088040 [Ichthyophthirius multifiliis]|uniref:Uncharacterized protein n=1 Tax=Ichthyophthirius multifiliis TaxID=5932 RepID=G0QR31_ICHMU|nr:hypothetical protein IMG5_088040 [Ichthyophthirius multifiliis]EGR32316.1 hypothetical protein IMG5_088040 [Ichthyophthirius multifiliis]|eukprot:XP_004035802.1 hypothetical protein IMG5_088040 [Ichthyophthirius multifiliis]
MDIKQTMQQMMEESEQEFKNQFNPQSDKFHQGSQVVVPLGGSRIPESMKSEYPENQGEIQNEENVSYGEEYEKIQNLRNDFLNFKKTISNIPKIHEQNLRQNQNDKENKEILKILFELEPLTQKVLQSEFKDRYEGLQATLESSKGEFKNKEDLTDFGFKIKKYSANAFTDAGKLLDKMKKIKKEKQKEIKQ